MSYDSFQDTIEHIHIVQDHMLDVVKELITRAQDHDLSKLDSPEKEAWDIATPKLKDTEYGSEKYRATLREIRPAVQHHYEHNTHHPEHYATGINGMTLLDLVEMLCDWKAAGERHIPANNILDSIDYNVKRFGISDQLADILYNTAKGWWTNNL